LDDDDDDLLVKDTVQGVDLNVKIDYELASFCKKKTKGANPDAQYHAVQLGVAAVDRAMRSSSTGQYKLLSCSSVHIVDALNAESSVYHYTIAPKNNKIVETFKTVVVHEWAATIGNAEFVRILGRLAQLESAPSAPPLAAFKTPIIVVVPTVALPTCSPSPAQPRRKTLS
jgi:hypothetical protein